MPRIADGSRQSPIERPIFLVGMPRSGTTLMLEVFTGRSDLAWFSRPLNRVPWLPAVCVIERLARIHPSLRSTIYRSDQIGPGVRQLRRLERVRLGPTQGENVWRHWCGERFMSDFLIGVEATEQERQRLRELVAKVMRYEGRSRFVGKTTGPAHICYLSSVFPDALFVHVIRDGSAVVHSLLNFTDWRDTFRLRQPAWSNGLGERQLERWRESGGSPLALAALEWRAVIESARGEAAEFAPQRYVEIRYEDFLADPHAKLDEITAFCHLPLSSEPHAFLDRRVRLRDMNYQWREAFRPEEVEMLDRLIGDLLAELGYRSPSRSAAGAAGQRS
jgi:hypothetical protein